MRTLKLDSLGRVERVEQDGVIYARRVATGGSVPGSAWLARVLLARERRALAYLGDLGRVPHEVTESQPGVAESQPDKPGSVLLRTWVEGEPLHLAESLPEDFFERLLELVGDLHRRGVCHNDLHKEQNVIVGSDGYPGLVDFQLASSHRRPSALFKSRVRDDLRHVQKHRLRYTCKGRGPGTGAVADDELRMPRTLTAALWRRLVKPVYLVATRRVLGTRDGEARRTSQGPWPAWTPPVGPRARKPG